MALLRNRNEPSTPTAVLPPGFATLSERCVSSTPTLLCRNTSRFSRTTEKPVGRAWATSSSPVRMCSMPTSKPPTRPVMRPPACTGTWRPSSRPMRRL